MRLVRNTVSTLAASYYQMSSLSVTTRTQRFLSMTTAVPNFMPQLQLRVAECNDMSVGGSSNPLKDLFMPFTIEGINYGYVPQTMLPHFSKHPDVFTVGDGALSLTAAVVALDLHGRTAAVAKVTEELKNSKVITGWRGELLPVVATFNGSPALLMERAAMPLFGFKAYGVHVTGFVRDTTTGDVSHMWVARRSKTKSSYPSYLDHIVAGGQPYGISPAENVIKECGEEANIPADLAAMAKAAGAVSYMFIEKNGRLKRETLFCYDLELPTTFTPTPVDGEVESFELKPLTWVLATVAAGGASGYKPNCNLVVIDFLIRHGIISPENEDYLPLLSSLRLTDVF
jgi:8-oxo-dGTP pyrophosphatase MutT (NUDIX family)